MFIYLCVWSGSSHYEPPQYEVTATEDAAWKLIAKWEDLIEEGEGDWLDVLRLDLRSPLTSLTVLERPKS